MSDIAELLTQDELDVRMMAALMGLPKSEFLRLLGDNEQLEKTVYDKEMGLVKYRFALVEKEPRKYLNLGYMPPNTQDYR